MTTDKRQPWMKFYPTDWRADPALRMCSRAARSLWLDLMGLMHEASPYGFLLVKGKTPTIGQLVSLLGDPAPIIVKLRGELQEHGVFSRVGDVGLDPDLAKSIPAEIPAGTIFSRRMVRDAAKAAANHRNGKAGGNPKLKTKAGVNPQDKAHMPEARSQTSDEANASSGDDATNGAYNREFDTQNGHRMPEFVPLTQVAPPDGDIAWALFNPGLAWLMSIYQEPPGKLRGVIGGWMKLAREKRGLRAGEEHRAVWESLVQAFALGVADPKSWMVAALGGRSETYTGQRRAETTVGGGGETDFQRRLREWRDGGGQGPMPTPDAALVPAGGHDA